MAATFPTSPINGEYAVVNSITYVYASAEQSWTRVPGTGTTQTAGGLPGQVQYNGLANFAGSPGFTFDSTSNAVTVTGNITGSYILGNGSQLTGIDATSIQYGTSNVRVVSANGNITTSVDGTSNVVVFYTGGLDLTGNISATGNVTATAFYGDGSNLTGIDASKISNGTSNVAVASSGNVTTTIDGNVVTVVSAGGLESQFITSPRTISANTTVAANVNAMSAGPITIADGVTVTVASGGEWSIV